MNKVISLQVYVTLYYSYHEEENLFETIFFFI